MFESWAGRSERDQAVRAYVEDRVHWTRSENPQHPVTLLLGPRGSGKTTLLRHLEDVACDLPHAYLDFAAMGREGRTYLETLAFLTILLHERKKRFPRFEFRSFGTAAIAASAPLDLTTPRSAAQSLLEALAKADPETARVLAGLADAAAIVLPAPAQAILRALPTLRNVWLRWLIRRRLAHLSADRPNGLDFLIGLKLRLDSGDEHDRRKGESELLTMVLADLRRMYRSSPLVAPPPTRCVLLLDNVDSALGDHFLGLLLEVRGLATGPDPLLVVATAGSYPQAIRDERWRGRVLSGVVPGRWPAEEEDFRPEDIGRGLRIGWLRDLRRPEVQRQAKEVIRGAGRELLPRKVPDGVRWLGWAVHDLTRGHPAATERVFQALARFDETTPWDLRLQRIFAPPSKLVEELLERLLPFDASEELTRMLPYAAAAVEPTQAEAAGLTGPPGSAIRAEFEAFTSSGLPTLHIDTGDPRTDGPPETLHPALRLLLLHRLAADPDRWQAAHSDLRATAEISGQAGAVAYHSLALGDVRTAATYLSDRFGIGTEQTAWQWCEDLCRLRRAPIFPLRGDPPDAPSERYERLVDFLDEGRVTGRQRTITRLVAAIWIAPEPAQDERTDRVGDPFHHPLGDPGAELYGEVAARLRTLAYGVQDGAWRRVLRYKAEQYEEAPW